MVLAQTYLLPLNQQSIIKKLLAECLSSSQISATDVENMVLAAGKNASESLGPISSSRCLDA